MGIKIAESKVFTHWNAGWQGFDIHIEFHCNLTLTLSLGL